MKFLSELLLGFNVNWKFLNQKKKKLVCICCSSLPHSLQQVYLFAYEPIPCHESATETSKLLEPLLARSQFILIFGVRIFVQSLKEIEIIS